LKLELYNKRVLITGGSRGIGLSVAKGFLQEGARVCMVSRGSQALYEHEQLFQKEYGVQHVFSKQCDCTNIESLKILKDEVEKQWEGLDVVVVNVGDGRSTIEPLPDNETWQKTWNSNFESSLQTARTFLPMLEQSQGVLLFISSIAGIEAFGAPTDYSTAKAAIIALAKNLARKLAPKVRVNVVAPGNVYFKDGSWDEKIKEDKAHVENIINTTVPMKRFASPEEIADAVLFLSSERAKFITGTTLTVDGGQTVGVM